MRGVFPIASTKPSKTAGTNFLLVDDDDMLVFFPLSATQTDGNVVNKRTQRYPLTLDRLGGFVSVKKDSRTLTLMRKGGAIARQKMRSPVSTFKLLNEPMAGEVGAANGNAAEARSLKERR